MSALFPPPMETQLSTRSFTIANGDDRLGGGFMGSFALHLALTALLLCWAWIFHSGQSWGDAAATSGAIQATLV